MFTWIDLVIPVVFILAIYGIMKYHKKRLNQRRHEIANSLEYPNALPALDEPRFVAIFDHLSTAFRENGHPEYVEKLRSINFYVVPGDMKLNGQRIYGLALSVYNRVFLDMDTIVTDSNVNAYGLVIHEFAHMLLEHTRGGTQSESEANEFTKLWLKKILNVDF